MQKHRIQKPHKEKSLEGLFLQLNALPDEYFWEVRRISVGYSSVPEKYQQSFKCIIWWKGRKTEALGKTIQLAISRALREVK